MYFTSFLNYAKTYGQVFVMSGVISGNVYPVTEASSDPLNSLEGAPFINGYQSHYLLGFFFFKLLKKKKLSRTSK